MSAGPDEIRSDSQPHASGNVWGEDSPRPSAHSADASQTLAALMDRRLELEERLLEFDAALKQLKAVRLPSTAAPALTDMKRALERFDSDLTLLAGVVHDLSVELERRALLDAAAPRVESVIFVRAGDRTFAVRASQVAEVRAWHAEQHEETHRELPTALRVVSLRAALALPQALLAGTQRLLVLSGAASSGLLVDDVIRQDEVVIRTLGPLLAGLKLYSGAAVASRGELVPVVDACEIVSRAAGQACVS